jgi:hypothetical protein
MLKIVPAETATHYQQIRMLLAEFIATDTAQMNELGLDAKASLEFYFASGGEELPGIYAPPNGRIFLASYSEKTERTSSMGLGYSGHGVNLTSIFGRIIADLEAGREEHWKQYPFLNASLAYVPNEPFRWLGAQSGLAWYRLTEP